MAEQTLNIPQLIAVVLVGFLAIRWFLSPSNPQSDSRRQAGRQINPEQIEQVLQMFPQLDRRSIIWDLQRNGGSVQATTERVLSGRALDNPPPSFQPQIPTPRSAVAANPLASSHTPTSAQQDLIARYNLSSRISTPIALPETGSTTSPSPSDKKPAWSQNRTERSEQFRKRREEMVLAARRKMEQREAAEHGKAET